MVTVTLKKAVTFRVVLGEHSSERTVAFSTDCFRATSEIEKTKVTKPTEHVQFFVSEIVLDGSNPWFTLQTPIILTMPWANVLSVQYEKPE